MPKFNVVSCGGSFGMGNIMHHFKCALFAAVAAVGFTSVGCAADMSAPIYKAPVSAPPYNWTGLYAGGNVGYSWGDSSNASLVGFVDPGGLFGFGPFTAAGGFAPPSLNPSGVLGGAQIGYNWQFGPNFVAGLVTDFQGADISDSGTNTLKPGRGFATVSESESLKISSLGTLRAKAGFAASNWLLYGTGGLAYGKVNATGSFVCVAPCVLNEAASVSGTNAGWTIGAGIDYGLSRNWTVGLEYLYYNLGAVTATLVPQTGAFPGSSVTVQTGNFAGNILRATLNYKFN
jgi:outer membrane immunogenic protein